MDRALAGDGSTMVQTTRSSCLNREFGLSVIEFSKDLIAVSDELCLCAKECLQDGAGQTCVMPMKLKVFDALFLVGHVLLATQQVALSLF
jgi:hypothetical protein